VCNIQWIKMHGETIKFVTFGFWHGAFWQVTNTIGGIFYAETLVYPYQTTRCHNPQDQHMNCSVIFTKLILVLTFESRRASLPDLVKDFINPGQTDWCNPQRYLVRSMERAKILARNIRKLELTRIGFSRGGFIISVRNYGGLNTPCERRWLYVKVISQN